MPRPSSRADRIIGATAEPEIESGRLEPHPGGDLEHGFAIEDRDIGASTPLMGVEAGSGHFTNVRFEGTQLGASRLRGVRLRDVVAHTIDASNADWTGATMGRVVFEESRLTGMQLAEADLREVAFRRCKLDLANLRMARLSHVTFEECVLVDTDFAHAKLELIRFASCQIRNGEFRGAELSEVDFRGSELAFRGDVRALRGAIVTPLQLMELSRALAHEAGISVREE